MRIIEDGNAKLARRIAFAKSTIPAQDKLSKDYSTHLYKKSLRCKLPIVDMKSIP